MSSRKDATTFLSIPSYGVNMSEGLKPRSWLEFSPGDKEWRIQNLAEIRDIFSLKHHGTEQFRDIEKNEKKKSIILIGNIHKKKEDMKLQERTDSCLNLYNLIWCLDEVLGHVLKWMSGQMSNIKEDFDRVIKTRKKVRIITRGWGIFQSFGWQNIKRRQHYNIGSHLVISFNLFSVKYINIDV